MKAIGFSLVEATNPNTGDVTKKIRVNFDNAFSCNLLTDLTVEDIKKDRDAILGKIEVRDGEFGKYAIIRRITVLEEF